MGIKPVELTEFLRWLGDWAWTEQELTSRPVARRLSGLQFLAHRCMAGRSHISQVINGRRSGGYTWSKIWRVLPADGRAKLELCPAWNKAKAGKKLNVEISRFGTGSF